MLAGMRPQNHQIAKESFERTMAARFEAPEPVLPEPKAGRTMRVVRMPTMDTPGIVVVDEVIGKRTITDTYAVSRVPCDGPAVRFVWIKTATTGRREIEEPYTTTVEPIEGYTFCTCKGAKYAKSYTDAHGEVRYVPCRHSAASLRLAVMAAS